MDRAVTLADAAFPDYRALARRAAGGFSGADRGGDPGARRPAAGNGAPGDGSANGPADRGAAADGRATARCSPRSFGRAPGWRRASTAPSRSGRPSPRPDLRRMLIPLGPVAVFGASNFPFAFSVAGGDTASALAAGCPVVVKAHPAHPGTSEMAARAVLAAADATRDAGRASSPCCTAAEAVGLALVRHPLLKAVGFTGSLRAGGRCSTRPPPGPRPIPVYAEMGSVNPVFVLPGALRERGRADRGRAGGVGDAGRRPVLHQPRPGRSAWRRRRARSVSRRPRPEDRRKAAPASCCTPASARRIVQGAARLRRPAGVRDRSARRSGDDVGRGPGRRLLHRRRDVPARRRTGGRSLRPIHAARRRRHARGRWMRSRASWKASSPRRSTAPRTTCAAVADLIAILETKVGRLLFNGFPTGVEVCPAMQHGGPYPATTDSRTTRSARRPSSASPAPLLPGRARRTCCRRAAGRQPAQYLAAGGQRSGRS